MKDESVVATTKRLVAEIHEGVRRLELTIARLRVAVGKLEERR